MSLAVLIRSMSAAGAPPEAIAIAVEAIEAARAQSSAVEDELASRRAYARDKKRRQRAAAAGGVDNGGDSPGTVPGQSRDNDGTNPSLDKSPQTPKINPTPHTGEAPTCVREAETPAGIQPRSFAIAIVSTAWTLRAARWKGTPPPAGVADDCWAGFIEHRKAHPKGGKLTDRAYRLLCNKLATLADDGHPPGAMLDRAVEHGWITVYPPKEPAHVRHRPANDRDGHRNSMVRAGLAREARYAGEPEY